MDKFLKKNYPKNTAKQLADKLGITHNAVEHRTRVILKLKKNKTYDDKDIIRLYKKGLGFTQIGKKVKLSHKSVARILDGYGLIIRECVECKISLDSFRSDKKWCDECMKVRKNDVILPMHRATKKYQKRMKAYGHKYVRMPDVKARRRELSKKPSYRAIQTRYNLSEAGKRNKRKYNLSPKGLKKRDRYNKSEKGRATRIYIKQRRRAMEKLLNTKFTTQEWLEKLESARGICLCCKKKRKLTMDHIVPIVIAPVGFTYEISDVQPLCQPCNSVKHAKIIKY